MMMRFELRSALFAAEVLVAPLLFSGLMWPNVVFGQDHLRPCSIEIHKSFWDDCQGAITLDNGNFVGEFKGGKANGQGTYTFANGNKYVGEFKGDIRNGQATYTFANGDKYAGAFKDDRRHGQGTYIFANGDKIVGEFKGGKADGQGTYTYANGNKYVGEFKGGERNGQATYTFANGAKYVGQFGSDNFNGRGTYFAANGSVSSGIWADGKLLTMISDQETIRMEERGGVYVVPVRFNDTITLNSVVDSGAADVSVPADIVSTLMRSKTITVEDFMGKQTYVLADGSKVPSQQFRIRSIKVGNKTVENVVARIASVNGEILLGQSFLQRFKSWSVDNEQHNIILR